LEIIRFFSSFAFAASSTFWLLPLYDVDLKQVEHHNAGKITQNVVCIHLAPPDFPHRG
jgi:hypothetical protein